VISRSTPQLATAPLIDAFGRRVHYLRVSVTDRCNLRCSYCMPEGPDAWESLADQLTPVELERVLRVAAEMGVDRVRLTGGEPLLRPDLVEIAARVGAIPGIRDLSLTTNGIFLDRLAGPLRQAGVHRLNVSLDSLDRHTFARVTGRDRHAEVLAGITAALAAGFHPVKLNIVALAAVNGHEVLDFVAFARRTGVFLRFIEEMPMGTAEAWHPDRYLSCETIQREIESVHALEPVNHAGPGNGPARIYRIAGTETLIGFITPISANFCAACNRMRITPDGFIRPCLSPCDEYDLKVPLRQGGDDQAIAAVFRLAVGQKPERHHFQWDTPVVQFRTMSQIGG
jgi:cyclic pyranopterin phosphate synthase